MCYILELYNYIIIITIQVVIQRNSLLRQAIPLKPHPLTTPLKGNLKANPLHSQLGTHHPPVNQHHPLNR